MGIRIVLADDHAILRDGLSQAFEAEEDMEIVGQAGDGHAAVEKARELLPDIVVMDINMPNLNGIEATREIRRDVPGVHVIVLSMHSAKPCIKEIFRAGAFGLPAQELRVRGTGARRAHRGGRKDVRESLDQQYRRGGVRPARRRRPSRRRSRC